MSRRNQNWPMAIAALLLSLILSLQLATTKESNREEASPIYYETPSLARLSTAAAKQLHKGCVYNKQKYQSGDEVQTEQPCLRCICKKAILMCSLLVCPPVTSNLTGSLASKRCQVRREPNTCCPRVHCDEPLLADGQVDNESRTEEANGEIKSNVKSVTTVNPLISLDNGQFLANLDREGANKSAGTPKNPMVSVTHLISRNMTILQTVPSSSLPDKELHSSRPLTLHALPSKESYVSELLSGFGTSCLPRYESEFACCPTSFACTRNDALSTSSVASTESKGKWSLFYAFDDKLGNLESGSNSTHENSEPEFDSVTVNEISQEDAQISTTTMVPTEMTTEPTSQTTTVTPIATNNLIGSLPRMNEDCVLYGVSFKAGDPMPSDVGCAHCYCAVNGTRICKAIQCSLPIAHHCTPVIPEGHCCPIEYKCDAKPVPTQQEVSSTSEQALSRSEPDSIEPEPESSNSIDVSNGNAKEVTISELASTTEGGSLFNVETTTLTIPESEKVRPTELKMFSLFSSPTEGNETKLVTEQTQPTIVEEMGVANRTSQTNSTVKAPLSKTLEARNLADDPQLEEYNTKLSGKVNNERDSDSTRNGTSNSMKLENVAHFLSNFLNVLGFASKANVDHRKPSQVEKFRDPLPKPPHSVLLVQNDHNAVPSMIRSATGENVEIITAFPPAQLNHPDEPKSHSELVVGASMQSGQLGLGPAAQVETMKSMRNVPQGQGNFLSKNVPIEPPNVHPKMQTFANGWRAIKPLRPRPAHQAPIERPNVSEKKDEGAPKNEATVTGSPMSSTRAQVEAAVSQVTKSSRVNPADTTTPSTDADINKAKCSTEGKEYENGDKWLKAIDPCMNCVCFYGTEICQEQKCPEPPSPYCVAKRTATQCCPEYTCRENSNEVLERSPAASIGTPGDMPPEKSAIRKGPQFQPEFGVPGGKDKAVAEGGMKGDLPAKSRFEGGPNTPAGPPMNRPPHHFLNPGNPPRISFPLDTMPRPLNLAYGSRVHFPQHKLPPNLPPNHPNLPPGLIQPPVMQNPLFKLNMPFRNLPFIVSHPQNGFKSDLPKMEDTRGGPVISPIRSMPQSPTQLKEANQNFKPRPAMVTTEATPPPPSSTTSTTEKPTQQATTSQPSGPWDALLQVSGCNIYGKMYQTGEEVDQLSSECKKCFCSIHGVQCKQIELEIC